MQRFLCMRLQNSSRELLKLHLVKAHIRYSIRLLLDLLVYYFELQMIHLVD